MKQVQKRVKTWKTSRVNQSDSPEQIEWASHVVQYVNFMVKKTTTSSESGSKKQLAPPALRKEIPILGPRFVPPGYLHMEKRNSTPNIIPISTYLKPLHVVHPFYYPSLKLCPQCDSTNVSWKGWVGPGYREVHGVSREETAIGYQLECEPCKQQYSGGSATDKGVFCLSTTNIKFWARRSHWEIPRE